MAKYILIVLFLSIFSVSLLSANLDKDDPFLVHSSTKVIATVSEYVGISGKIWQRVEETTCVTEVREWPKEMEQKDDLRKKENETQS